MSKFLKWALAGAVVGAGAATGDAYQRDRPVGQLAKNVALCGAGGAALGVLLGSRLGRIAG